MSRAVRVAAVIPAGGSGLRMREGGEVGPGVRKQYLSLEGEPILVHAVRAFVDHPAVEWIVVAMPPEDVGSPPVELPVQARVVAGGTTRSESVRKALEAVPEEADVVLIHDGARPLLPAAVIDRVLTALRDADGAVAALPVADTLKRVEEGGVIRETVDRSGLWRAQTPQGFGRTAIVDAHRRAVEDGAEATDDAALVERYGGNVVVVEGDPRNLKVTRPRDLEIARLLFRGGRG